MSSSSWGSETPFLLATRTIGEYEAVTQAQPRAAVYRAWEPDSPVPEETEAVAVVCCAFGVIHPGSVVTSLDLERTGEDDRTLRAIIGRYPNLPLHVVFISSVLALCPGPGREYYAGWKNVVEALVRRTACERGNVRMSVFYPGRLVETRQIRRPSSFLHTSYGELAEAVVSSVQQKRSREAVLGLDSRLWLALRSFRLACSALTGRR